ncbi:AAA domain-containing protein [Pelagophyceae sp. CCMP2097]|nr:AAA domain-containing protein [Pelagophyceae sp. CCMP2097]
MVAVSTAERTLLYVVKAKAGCAVREAAALESKLVCETLRKGTEVRGVVGGIMRVGGLARVRIVAPCNGWITLKCVTELHLSVRELPRSPDSAGAVVADAAVAPGVIAGGGTDGADLAAEGGSAARAAPGARPDAPKPEAADGGASDFRGRAASPSALVPEVAALRQAVVDDASMAETLAWMAKKAALGEDMLLLCAPGPLARGVVARFCAAHRREAEYVSVSRDTAASDLKQRRELAAGANTLWVDGPAVRAAKSGRVLVLEGVQSAEPNVLSVLNNLLEHREMPLEDGTLLTQHFDARVAAAVAAGAECGGLARVDSNFLVVAISTDAAALDPPLRSRFAARRLGPPSVEATRRACLAVSPLLGLKHVDAVLDCCTALRGDDDAQRLTGPDAFSAAAALAVPCPQAAVFSICNVLGRTATPDFDSVRRTLERAYPFSRNDMRNLAPASDSRAIDAALRDLERAIGPGAPPRGREVRARTGCRPDASAAQPEGRIGRTTQQVPRGRSGDSCGDASGVADLAESRRRTVADLLLDHAAGLDLCIIGPRGSGKSAVASEFARRTGMKRTTVFCHSGLGARDLLQRRDVDAHGDTVWRDSSIVAAAVKGGLVVLDGIDRLQPGVLVAALGQLLCDRTATLPDGSRLTSRARFEAASCADARPVDAAFRVVALCTCEDGFIPRDGDGDGLFSQSRLREWRDLLAQSFHFHVFPELRCDERLRLLLSQLKAADREDARSRQCAEARVLLRLGESLRRGPGPASFAAEALRSVDVGSARALKRLSVLLLECGSAEAALDRAVGARLRLLPRAARKHFEAAVAHARKVEDDASNDEREDVIFVDGACDDGACDEAHSAIRDLVAGPPPAIQRRSSADGRCALGDAASGMIVVTPTTLRLARDSAPGLGRAIEIARRAPTRHDLVPSVPSFVSIPSHVRLVAAVLRDVAARRSVLLIGNQGVGKNVICDRALELLRAEREYVQLHRDASLATLTSAPRVDGGSLAWDDSALVRAAVHGRVLVVDEADKAPADVVAVLKALLEDGEIDLADGRRLVAHGTEPPGRPRDARTIIAHRDFVVVVLANRPGWPFSGRDFYGECGDVMSSYLVDNPPLESELALVQGVAPTYPDREVLERLVRCFGELRDLADAGTLDYPYSTRELCRVARHLERFHDAVSDVLEGVVACDAHRAGTRALVRRVLGKYSLLSPEPMPAPDEADEADKIEADSLDSDEARGDAAAKISRGGGGDVPGIEGGDAHRPGDAAPSSEASLPSKERPRASGEAHPEPPGDAEDDAALRVGTESIDHDGSIDEDDDDRGMNDGNVDDAGTDEYSDVDATDGGIGGAAGAAASPPLGTHSEADAAADGPDVLDECRHDVARDARVAARVAARAAGRAAAADASPRASDVLAALVAQSRPLSELLYEPRSPRGEERVAFDEYAALARSCADVDVDRVRAALAAAPRAPAAAARVGRVWMRRQADGDLDDDCLVDALAGDRDVYKRRTTETRTQPAAAGGGGAPLRLKLCLDVSATTYAHDAADGRLKNLLQLVVLVAKALDGDDDAEARPVGAARPVVEWAVVGFSGQGPETWFKRWDRPLFSRRDRLDVVRRLATHAQYTLPGDASLAAMENAVAKVRRGQPSRDSGTVKGRHVRVREGGGPFQKVVKRPELLARQARHDRGHAHVIVLALGDAAADFGASVKSAVGDARHVRAAPLAVAGAGPWSGAVASSLALADALLAALAAE